MSFEPLQTDERLDSQVKRERDMDSEMLVGCTGFVLASVLHYFIGAWPFAIFSEIYLLQTLAIASACAIIPSLIFTAIATRKGGISTAAGCFGGGFAIAIFLYLRLEQFNLVRGQRDMPQPEFPPIWAVMLPAAWLFLILATVLFALKIEHVRDDHPK